MLTIEQLRQDIMNIDAEIIKCLAERESLSKQIGKLKYEQGKTIIDSSQEEKLFHFYHDLAQKYNLDSEHVKVLFSLIIIHSREIQQS